jgi:excinuclease UvrABC helicase subunit UvrB
VAAFEYAQKNGLGRTLVIEPSTRQAELIANTLTQMGHKVKLVHSGDRTVPRDESVHIVATQVVDAGITITNLKTVIDTGLSIINDRGEVRTVHANMATREQRAGRTGRQCDGVYISLAPVGRTESTPYPSLSTGLEQNQLAKDYKIKVKLNLRLDTLKGLF